MIYGYARVSTRKQLAYGKGLDTQKELLEKAGVPAGNIRVEQQSGAHVDDRPVWNKLFEELDDGDTLVVTSLDRISRSYEDGLHLVETLTDRGVKVNILNIGLADNSTPMGQLILRCMAAFADFERSVIIERTKEGRDRAIANGAQNGRPHKWPKERRKFAHDLHVQGKSYKEIEKLTGIPASTARDCYIEFSK